MQHLKRVFGLSLLFLLLVSSVSAFDFSICETPERALEELGDDYYAFCEQNVAPDYYSDAPALAEEQTPVYEIFIPSSLNETANEDYLFSGDADERDSLRIAPLLGLLLLLAFLGLIIWRTQHRRHLTTQAINKLLPTMKQYKEVGWTSDQLTEMLLSKGYERSFIKKLLQALDEALEPKP